MLRDLHIRNLALLESVSVSFSGGLSVVTGETGAGKSLVVDSLLLLSGARATSDLIRSGADSMTVTGVFETPQDEEFVGLLAGHGIDADEETVVRREVSREGRNRVYVNDTPVTLKLLTSLAPMLIRVHTQREELELIGSDVQRQWVDAYGGESLREAANATREAFVEFEQLDRRWRALVEDERTRLERIDLLQFQVGEIEAAEIQVDEEIGLRERRGILQNRDRVREALASTVRGLYEDDGAAGERIAAAARALADVAEWVPQADDWRNDLEDARLRVEETARAALAELDAVDEDPGELDRVEQRLADLERLFIKYGSSTQNVLQVHQGAAEELEVLLGDADNRDRLEADRVRALDAYRKVAETLSRERTKAGANLVKAVEHELEDLAMSGARLSVDISRRSGVAGSAEEYAISAQGWDLVNLMLAANPGEPEGPLATTASGGELSRIYLALQLVAREDRAAEQVTMVFDEVDAGVGGAEAEALGSKLRRLAEGGQLLVVTHLPQVASAGHQHLRVEKSRGERTTVQVTTLDESQRVDEVARMLAGRKVTDLSRSHAEDLLRQAAV